MIPGKDTLTQRWDGHSRGCLGDYAYYRCQLLGKKYKHDRNKRKDWLPLSKLEGWHDYSI